MKLAKVSARARVARPAGRRARARSRAPCWGGSLARLAGRSRGLGQPGGEVKSRGRWRRGGGGCGPGRVGRARVVGAPGRAAGGTSLARAPRTAGPRLPGARAPARRPPRGAAPHGHRSPAGARHAPGAHMVAPQAAPPRGPDRCVCGGKQSGTPGRRQARTCFKGAHWRLWW